MIAAGRQTPAGETLQAVIFDVDGVLIDTEPVWRRVETDVFGSLGIHLTEADCRETMGVRIDEVVDLWHSRRPWLGASRQAVVDRIVASRDACDSNAEARRTDATLAATA